MPSTTRCRRASLDFRLQPFIPRALGPPGDKTLKGGVSRMSSGLSLKRCDSDVLGSNPTWAGPRPSRSRWQNHACGDATWGCAAPGPVRQLAVGLPVAEGSGMRGLSTILRGAPMSAGLSCELPALRRSTGFLPLGIPQWQTVRLLSLAVLVSGDITRRKRTASQTDEALRCPVPYRYPSL